MGLYFGIHASHSHPVVQVRKKFIVLKCLHCSLNYDFHLFSFFLQYYEFPGDCPLSVWNGSYDYVEDTA